MPSDIDYRGGMRVTTTIPAEASQTDAPVYLDADHANGWADGFNTCRVLMVEAVAERDAEIRRLTRQIADHGLLIP